MEIQSDSGVKGQRPSLIKGRARISAKRLRAFGTRNISSAKCFKMEHSDRSRGLVMTPATKQSVIICVK